MKRIVAIAAAILVVAAALIAISTRSGRADAASGSSITVDKKISASGHGSATTAAFSAPADTLVAFVATDGAAGQTVKVSGAGLTWSLVERSNAQLGDAEIWTATATSALSNVTVKSTPAQSGYYQRLTVVAFGGANGVGTASAASGPAGSGAPTISLTVQQAGSLTYAVGDDYDNATARTVASDQTLVDQYLAPTGDTMWTQASTAGTSSAGQVVTLSDTAPTADRWDLASVEILQGSQPQPSSSAPSSSPAPSSSATPTPTPTSSSPSGGYPDATNTGVPAGTTLQRVPQDITSGPGWQWTTIAGEGVVDASTGANLSNLDIAGPVYNNGGTDTRVAGAITVTNTIIRCENEGNWCLTLGPGSNVSHSTIGGGADGKTMLGSLGIVCGVWNDPNVAMTTISSSNVGFVVQGFHQDGNCTIQDSYMHDFAMGQPSVAGAHSEGTFIDAGPNNVVEHDTFVSGNTADLFCQNNQGNTPVTGVTVDNSQFLAVDTNGEQSSFGVDIESTCKPSGSSAVSVTNNVFVQDPNNTFQVGDGQAPAGSTLSGNTNQDGSPASISTS